MSEREPQANSQRSPHELLAHGSDLIGRVTRACTRRSPSWPVLLSIVAIIFGGGAYSTWQTRQACQALDELVSKAVSKDAEFERAIGFGGLIHNLKNAVLRPGEPAYLAAAATDVVSARRLIGELQEVSDELELDLDWSETRTMVEAYGARVERLGELSMSATAAAELDSLVRFDDGPAIRERALNIEVLSSVVGLRRESANAALVSTGARMLLALAVLLGTTVWLSKRHEKLQLQSHRVLTESLERTSRANEALQQFAGIASHDLAKPIRHVQFYCELLRDEPESVTHVLEHVDLIEATTKNMNELIACLLKFTKVGFQRVEATPQNMTELVGGVVNSLLPDIERTNATVKMVPLHDVDADPDLITRVFSNLISNALKYTHEGDAPVVQISSSRDGTWVEYSVDDQGIGIDPSHAAQIFEPMRRLHGPQSKYPGFGLGLALAKAVVEGHGGSIRLDPAVLEGARFVIRLPLSSTSSGEWQDNDIDGQNSLRSSALVQDDLATV